MTIKNNLINISYKKLEVLWQSQKVQENSQTLQKRKLELAAANIRNGRAKAAAQMAQPLASFIERNTEDKANE